MIKINFYLNGFTVKGHANYSATNDVVCAGVSAIVVGALNWFDSHYVKLHLANGDVELFFTTPNQAYQHYLELLYQQLAAIKQNPEYTKHIKLSKNCFNFKGV